jgi:hypothetical protein
MTPIQTPSASSKPIGAGARRSRSTQSSLELPLPRLGALKAALTSARALGDGQAGQQSKTDQQISFRNR